MLKWLQNVAWLCLFGLLVFGFSSAVWQATEQSPPHHRVTDTQDRQKGNATSNIEADSKQNATEKGHWYHIFGERPTEWLLVLFNLFLVAFTGLLWWSTDKLWRAGEKQIRQMREISLKQDLRTQEGIRLAREEFLSSHRPQLEIRRVSVPEQAMINDRPMAVEFAVVNKGRTTGYLLGGIAKLDILPDNLPAPSYGDQDQVFHPRKFEPGATDQYSAVARFSRNVEARAGYSIHLVGYMVYRDEGSTTRTTYFCRRYVRELRRFSAVGDPDWESVD
jgi:hypothetical protein